VSDRFLDGANPCPCPQPVIELLALAVRYAEASLASSNPQAISGAHYVKTFMEQPANEWCAFIDAGGEDADRG
jgi:hypothetical protein